MDTASWRLMPPALFSRLSSSWTAARASSLRSCERE